MIMVEITEDKFDGLYENVEKGDELPGRNEA